MFKVEFLGEYSCGYNTVSGAFHKPGCGGECGIMNPGDALAERVNDGEAGTTRAYVTPYDDAHNATRRLLQTANARIAELEARLEAIDAALDDADAPDSTEAHALDADPIIERVKLWRHAQGALVDTLEAQLKEARAEIESATANWRNTSRTAWERNGRLEKQLAEAEARASRLEGALKIYAKPENWQCHKRQERVIWNYHPYEDGFKVAQLALGGAKEGE